MKAVIIWLTFVSLMAVAPTSWAAVLESPANGATLSGIGFISGWKCHANNITITIDDGEHLPVAMYQERGDLLTDNVCGGTINHGFIMQINWAILQDGEHEVVAYDNGVEFGRSEFVVGTIGGEEFLKGTTKEILVDDFPSPGEQTVFEWNESTQHFEALPVLGTGPTNNYDLAFWRNFTESYNRGARWQKEQLYVEEPDVGNCQAGRLTQTAKDRALEAANQIRALHDISPLKYSTLYDHQAQQAALIQEANENNFPGHFPHPSHKCYTEEGDEGSKTSNISKSSANLDPAAHIVNLADDANSRILPASAGHRRYIIDPFETNFSYGQVGKYATQKARRFLQEPDRIPQINVDFVAFPYETYPYLLLKYNPPWSFSVVVDKEVSWKNRGEFFNKASITVIRASDGSQLSTSNYYTDTRGFGLPNVITWKVHGWEHDTLYEVEIRNVTLTDGTIRNYSYSVFIEKGNLENQ